MPFRNRSILIADDDDICLEILREVLAPLGVRIVAVDDGLHALEWAKRERFDLILMDLQMPILGGREAARSIRSDSPNADTWIMAMSSDDHTEERLSCRAVGMDGLIGKPIGLDAIFEAVQTLLGRKRDAGLSIEAFARG